MSKEQLYMTSHFPTSGVHPNKELHTLCHRSVRAERENQSESHIKYSNCTNHLS